MKKILIIAVIVGLAYWYKTRKTETKAIEAAEPSLKSAWLLSATPSSSTSSSGSSESGGGSGDVNQTASPGSPPPSPGSSSYSPSTGGNGQVNAVSFGSLQKPKSCFR